MQKALSIAVVGCGYWGPNLIRNYRSLPECRVKLVCDVDHERLAYIKRLYPEAETTTDFKDLINDREVDAIAIATPVHSHFEFARKSLQAGKHTFIEKPMASSVAQCQELIELAEKRKLTLMVGHTFIYTAAVTKLKELVDSGDLGELCYISSSRLNLGPVRQDVNALWDLASHDISIILHLVGRAPVSVNCQGLAYLNKNIHDVCTLTLHFGGRPLGIVQSSWLDPNKVRQMTVVGDKKMAVYDDIEPLEKIKIYDKGIETPEYYDTFGEFHFSYRYGDTYTPWLKQVEPLKAECKHFIDCIKQGKKPKTDGRNGLEVVRVLEATDSSLHNSGGIVHLNPFGKNGA